MDVNWLRCFLVVVEEGSLNAAAERLGVAQSSLSRRIQALEQELGGPLLERSARGVAPTAAGREFARQMAGVVQGYDAGVQAVRQRLRGHTSVFRIGYLLSAASTLVNPALARVRQQHPEVRLQLLDQSPGEQIAALRTGTIDFALVGHVEEDLSRDFHVRCLARMGVLAAVGEAHPLSGADTCRLGQLSDSVFCGVPDADVPGYRHWVSTLCRRAGFRPRFGPDADSLSEGLSRALLEDTVLLLGAYARSLVVPGVRLIPVLDAPAAWHLQVAWAPGRTPQVVETLLAALSETATAMGGTSSARETG